MRVAADKQLRRLSVYFTLNQRTVPVGITANMGDPDINFFAIKPQVFGHNIPDIRAIDIAINTFKWFKGLQLFNHLQTAKIAGMPDLVATFKMFKNCIVKKAVGIGKEAYSRHLNKFEY